MKQMKAEEFNALPATSKKTFRGRPYVREGEGWDQVNIIHPDDPQPEVLDACAAGIVAAKARYNVATASLIFEIGEHLERAFVEIKSEGEVWEKFLRRQDVTMPGRDAREYREFFREYQPRVLAARAESKDFFIEAGLNTTSYLKLLRFEPETRETILDNAEVLRGSTVREVRSTAAAVEEGIKDGASRDSDLVRNAKEEVATEKKEHHKNNRRISVSMPKIEKSETETEPEPRPAVSDREMERLSTENERLRDENQRYRNALECLTGQKVNGQDTKQLVDAVTERIEGRYQELLSTPVSKLRGFATVYKYFEKMLEAEPTTN